jgi:hypothetical protein
MAFPPHYDRIQLPAEVTFFATTSRQALWCYWVLSQDYRSPGLQLTTHFNPVLNGKPWYQWFTTAKSHCHLGNHQPIHNLPYVPVIQSTVPTMSLSYSPQSPLCPCHTVHSPHYIPVIQSTVPTTSLSYSPQPPLRPCHTVHSPHYAPSYILLLTT